MKILVTGCAGFIGAAVAEALLKANHQVVGVDNLSPYYDVILKKARLKRLSHPHCHIEILDITDRQALDAVFSKHRFDAVIHLAAQAGVRYSLTNPEAYTSTNVVGFGHVLECCRAGKVPHLLFASSSSVYGANTKQPFSEQDPVDHPVSLYAATKRSNELMAHSYAHLFGLPCTGMRFFTVYGPWGRPDMALFTFAERILRNEPIDVYHHGNMRRDFTYVDDIVAWVVALLKHPPVAHEALDARSSPDQSHAPFAIYNLGNSSPNGLMEMITCLEQSLGKKAEKRFLPLQAGDVVETSANTKKIQSLTGLAPRTDLRTGIDAFVTWYRAYREQA